MAAPAGLSVQGFNAPGLARADCLSARPLAGRRSIACQHSQVSVTSPVASDAMLAPAEYTEQCVTAAETEGSDPETKGQASMHPPVPHRTGAVLEVSPALSSAPGSQQGHLLCQSRLLRPPSSACRPSHTRPCSRDMGAEPSCCIVSPPHAHAGTVELVLECAIHRPRQHQRPHPLLHHLGLNWRQLWRPLAIIATTRQA